MIIRPGLLAILILVTAAAALAQPGGNPPAGADRAKTAPANPPGTHTLNLKDADIQVLIATVSEITGKNFIIGPNVQGKVTVVSATPMKPDEIYETFLSVLRVNGYAAIPSGSMVKIVAEATAQQDGSGGLDGSGRRHETDELVTQIVPLKHVSATELVPILRPLMPQGAQLIAHPGSNSLVISDRSGNVQRLISIIGRIDTASDNGVEMITLQHASAAELARTLTQLNEGRASDLSADASKVFADERTNSILLSGGKSGRLRLRALITHLDTPISTGGDTNVVYLHYAAAKDLVPILRGVAATLTNEVPITAKAGGGENAGPANSASIATIQAHEDNNALIISAPPAVFRSLQNVIRQLDVRRSQVLIEAVIAEVSDETANELGVQWQLPLGNGNHVIGGTNFSSGNSSAAGNNILSAAVNPLGVGNGFNLGYIEGTVTVGNVKIFQLGALVTALRSDGKSNILSTPQVMTLDNQQAVIKVGQEVPFLTGSYQTTASSSVSVGTGGATAGGISNPFQTIQRKDVGLTLTVTPHINEGDSVKLEIHQIVSSLAPPVSGASDLVTNNREVQTTVLIKDGSVFVIGGLISDTIKDNNQQVPGLGSIPLLGNLFRYRSNDHVKQNLMVFLHPRILRDAVSEASVASEKYNFIRTEQIQMRENSQVLTPERDMPLLPDVHDFLSSPTLDPAPYTTPPPPKDKH